MADLLGLAFIMARVSAAVRCERPWHAKEDYDQLSRAVKTHRVLEEFILGRYHSDVRRVKWTIPDVRELERLGSKEPKQQVPVDESDGIARVVWGYLEERHPGITKVKNDTFLAYLVSKGQPLRRCEAPNRSYSRRVGK